MISRRGMMMTAIAAAFPGVLPAAPSWPLWETYAARLVDAQGRVIDRAAGDRTTSEAQSYGLFFSLVAGDRERFDLILDWTQRNLARGDLGSRLPAWLYGRTPGGVAAILDANPASDADLWLSWTLLQAGRIWQDKRYTELGLRLAERISEQEVKDLPGLGLMLLPGANGFAGQPGVFLLNASYLPLQLFAALAEAQPRGPWQSIAANVPRVIQGSAPAGFALDWISYRAGTGFVAEPTRYGKPLASYDAIRVYLWAGMLHPGTPGRWQILQALHGMDDHLKKVAFPASAILPDGAVSNAQSPLGFSAALMPFLTALDDKPALARQRLRVRQQFESGGAARYYDICLGLFALGWVQGRYRFDSKGALILNGVERAGSGR
jgi:endoglucanase